MSRQIAVSAMREGVDWRSLAACAERELDPETLTYELKVDPETFSYADDKAANRQSLHLAQTLCQRCVVKEECLAETMGAKDYSLFRAGLTAEELQALSRRNARREASNRRASQNR